MSDAPSLIGAAVDGSSRSRDAAALGVGLCDALGAGLMLIAVRAEPLVPVPPLGELDPAASEEDAWMMLAETRDAVAPRALLEVQTDVLVWRGLRHVVRAKHADLLVVGSGHDADEGRVRLGPHAGSLQSHLECPLAVAPRGAHERRDAGLAAIGVGLDARPESHAALDLAASLAAAAGAQLIVRTVVTDRSLGRLPAMHIGAADRETRSASAFAPAEAAVKSAGLPEGDVEVVAGRPSEQLLDLADHVDLLVVGSSATARRGRVGSGNTTDALLHDAPCAVVVTPRPLAQDGR